MRATPRILLLSAAVAVVLSACNREAAPPAAPPPAAPPAADKALTLDESKLPPFNQFQIGDLDTSKNA